MGKNHWSVLTLQPTCHSDKLHHLSELGNVDEPILPKLIKAIDESKSTPVSVIYTNELRKFHVPKSFSTVLP